MLDVGFRTASLPPLYRGSRPSHGNHMQLQQPGLVCSAKGGQEVADKVVELRGGGFYGKAHMTFKTIYRVSRELKLKSLEDYKQ